MGEYFTAYGMKVFVSERQPADKISVIGIDKGQPGGDWTAAVELERQPDGKWRLVRYAVLPRTTPPEER